MTTLLDLPRSCMMTGSNTPYNFSSMACVVAEVGAASELRWRGVMATSNTCASAANGEGPSSSNSHETTQMRSSPP